MFCTDATQVELQEDGDFFIQWETIPSGQPVTVYSGLSEDTIEYDKPLVTTEDSQANIPGLNRDSRRYFCLQGKNSDTHIFAERRLPFEGTRNFRDLGGYQSVGGGTIKWGLLYRSGRLSALTGEDQKYFSSLNIGLICDFRREDEQERSPSLLPKNDPVKIVDLPIGAGSSKKFLDKMASDGFAPEDMKMAMQEIYLDFVQNQAETYSEMFKCLLEVNNEASLIHCTAGKDRTGFGTAIILSALGVERQAVMQDYLLTTRYFPIDLEMKLMAEKYDIQQDIYLHAFRPVFEVHPEYLQVAFDEIEKEYKTVENYLDKALGVTQEVCKELQAKFLTA